MQGRNKDDSVVMKALELQSRGHHGQAARLFREAGNQIRDPKEKKMLWNCAKNAEHTRDSD